MEAAGIEPASENDPSENLHACQVPIFLCPGLRSLQGKPGHEPIGFRPPPPGQPREAILSEVTSFNRPTGEPVKNGLRVRQPVLVDIQQLIVSTFLRGHGPRHASLPSAFPSKPVRPPFFDAYPLIYIGVVDDSVNAV